MSTHTIPAHRLRIMIRILSDETAAGEAFPGTYAGRLLVVRDWLLDAAVTDVAIERENERAIIEAKVA